MTNLAHAQPQTEHQIITSPSESQNLHSVGDDPAIAIARQQAQAENLPFAGSLSPADAWRLVALGLATLVDIRTNEERKFVGYVPESLHVAWMTGTSMTRNPRFIKEWESKVKDKSRPVLLLCRSGKRSADAAQALSKAGHRNVFNILEGFEGELDSNQQRGHAGGWRIHGLPWVQD